MNQKTSTFGEPESRGYNSIMMLEASTRLRLNPEEIRAKPAPRPEAAAPAKPAQTPAGQQALWAGIVLALFTVWCCWVIGCLRGL